MTIFKIITLSDQKKGTVIIYNSILTVKDPFVDEDHVIWLKAPEQLLNRPNWEIVFAISVIALIILQRHRKEWDSKCINDEENTKGKSKWNLCNFCWNILQTLSYISSGSTQCFRIAVTGFMSLSKFDLFLSQVAHTWWLQGGCPDRWIRFDSLQYYGIWWYYGTQSSHKGSLFFWTWQE